LQLFKPRAPRADPNLPRTVLGAMREDRGRFADLRDARVLVYWPHGLGDWVHLSTIAPLLEQSNTYAITRFGDDYVSAMDGNRYFTPLYSGVRAPGDGTDRGACHFGIELRGCNGGRVKLALPPPLDEEVLRFSPEALLWTDYPETEGRTAYPFHTKARNLARFLVRPDRLSAFDLSQPLRSTLDFSVPEALQSAVDERLARFAPPDARIAIVSRAGVTAARKNWGDAGSVRELLRGLRARDPRWHVVSMDGDAFEGVASYRELFGAIDEPFARTLKAVLARTALVVGVPAGPLHLAMARGGIAVVGLWLAHHPDWYEEPNPRAIHLIGRYVRDRGFDKRPATVTKPASLQHRIVNVETPYVPVGSVLEAIEAVTA
jgi:hypothetical protein